MSRTTRLRVKLRKRVRRVRKFTRKIAKRPLRGYHRARAKNVAAAKYLRRLIRREQATRIITRAEWGAAPPRGGYTRQGTLVAGVQHHTAMATFPKNAGVEAEMVRMRDLQRIHQGQGWTDIGYALVVMPSGRIYEGRPAWAVGAHTLGHNTGYAGWAADGNYEIDRPTPELIAGCRRARIALGVADKPLFGHFQLNPTACPGQHLKPHLGKEI